MGATQLAAIDLYTNTTITEVVHLHIVHLLYNYLHMYGKLCMQC